MSSHNSERVQQGQQTSVQPSQQQRQNRSSPIPTQFRAISRNNSNTSTTSSSNKGEFSSTISTTNSFTSSRSQLSKLIDHRQLLATCGSGSTPIRSFQRATISSVVKTRAFDNSPVLQGLLTSAAPSGQNSVTNSQTPSPLSTPVFSRSRSLRMSGGPRRYQQSPSHYVRTSRTPDLHSFNNSGDMQNFFNESQAKILELSSEKSDLKESLEFLECEREVLMNSAHDLKETLDKERQQWKKELDDLKRQLTDTIAARVKAESQLTQKDVGSNDILQQIKKLNDDSQSKDKEIYHLRKNLDTAYGDIKGLTALNDELKRMLSEKLRYNGLTNVQQHENSRESDCASIVTEMARLRLELNERNKLIKDLSQNRRSSNAMQQTKSTSCDIESLNKFLDQTVECIKGWPDELSGSSHVQNLMKSLLSAYQPETDELSSKIDNMHLEEEPTS